METYGHIPLNKLSKGSTPEPTSEDTLDTDGFEFDPLDSLRPEKLALVFHVVSALHS
jgi:hypothetical protein